MFCPKCGCEQEDGASFCSECGASIFNGPAKKVTRFSRFMMIGNCMATQPAKTFYQMIVKYRKLYRAKTI